MSPKLKIVCKYGELLPNKGAKGKKLEKLIYPNISPSEKKVNIKLHLEPQDWYLSYNINVQCPYGIQTPFLITSCVHHCNTGCTHQQSYLCKSGMKCRYIQYYNIRNYITDSFTGINYFYSHRWGQSRVSLYKVI